MNQRLHLFALLLAVAVAVAACGATANADVFGQANSEAAKVPAFRSTITVTGKRGQQRVSTASYAPPDRMYVNAGGTETIVIKGAGLWVRHQGGPWQTIPLGDTLSSAALSIINPARVESIVAAVVSKKFKLVGNDAIGGKQMNVYKYMPGVLGVDRALSSIDRVWVGAADGLLYRSVSADRGGEQTVVDIEYDPAISIEPPSL